MDNVKFNCAAIQSFVDVSIKKNHKKSIFGDWEPAQLLQTWSMNDGNAVVSVLSLVAAKVNEKQR